VDIAPPHRLLLKAWTAILEDSNGSRPISRDALLV
jgi:hypothetical protein